VGTYFRLSDSSIHPRPATAVELHQGKLESANFTPAEAAVRLVGIMRQFEMLQKAMALGSEMNRKAVEEVARVGS
jgi:flagellar basal body rod protein FlgG